MPSLVENVETMEELDTKIIYLQNKLDKRNDEYNALIAQIRHARAKGMSQEEERRYNQRMREVSYQIRTIERRFDRLWDKKLYFRQLCGMESGK
jgi:seryl-tRNA synthetase